ncbi:MAG: DUF1080 domain-containing protein [Myxococcales bacterium]|nr:DUF1080 domain-containing protein [Myxococcales bacterium]
MTAKPICTPAPAAGLGFGLPGATGFSLVDLLVAFALIGLCAAALAAGSVYSRKAPLTSSMGPQAPSSIGPRAPAGAGKPAATGAGQPATTGADLAPSAPAAIAGTADLELDSNQQAASKEHSVAAHGHVGVVGPIGWTGLSEGRDRDGESAFAAGSGTVAPFEAAGPVSRAALRRYEGKTAVLWTDTRADYATELMERLDSFLAQAHAEMAQILDVQATPKPVQIYVFESQERYQDYAREHAPGLVNNGGFYDGGMRTVVTYRYNNSMQLYFHELVHAMMGEQFADHNFTRYTRRHWPVWFDEGMAEYLGSFELHAGKVKVPALNNGKLAYLYNALASSMFIDMASLLKAPAERFSGASMNIYYAEAWGLLQFLLSNPSNRPKMAQFFRRIKAGEDGVVAFKAAFGDDLTQLDEAWRVYLLQLAQPRPGKVALFAGDTVDDWTIHEGGQWRAANGEIAGTGDRNYNYLIKNEIPAQALTYSVDVNLQRGTAGLILGNNFHGEYPYYYLIEFSRDVVMLRRAWSASQIEPVIQAYAEVPVAEWVTVKVSVVDRVLTLWVGEREVLKARTDRDRYSLFGLYLYKAKARFRNVTLERQASGYLSGVATSRASAGGPAQPALSPP